MEVVLEKNQIAQLGTAHKMSGLRAIFLFLILFGLEFDVDLYGPISLRKIAFVLLLFFVFQRGIQRALPFRKSHIIFWLGAFAVFLYAVFTKQTNLENISAVGNVSIAPIQYILICLSFFVFPLLLSHLFDSLDEFCNIQLGIIVIQSVVAIVSRLNKPFRLFIYQRFAMDDGRMLDGMTSGIRVSIIGGNGASASWILFIGCVICTYFAITKKKPLYLAIYALIMLSMMFVGRTGLYMALILLVFFFFYSMRGNAKLTRTLLLIGICGVLLIAAYILFAPDSYLKSTTIKWVGEIFFKGVGEGSTVDILINMGIPPLTRETFWGTGIITGATKSGLSIHSDSGYVHQYMAYGLVGALLYYSWAYGFFAHGIRRVQDKQTKLMLWVFLAFIAFVELKEPFLRKTPNAMVLVTMEFIQLRCQQKGSIKTNG